MVDNPSQDICIECGCTRPRFGLYMRCARHFYLRRNAIRRREAFRHKYEAEQLLRLVALARQQPVTLEPTKPPEEPPEEPEDRPYRYRPSRCNARGCEELRAEASEFCAHHTEAFVRRCQGENWRGGRKEYVGNGYRRG